MFLKKIATLGGVFLFVIIVGEWLMMQPHGNKDSGELFKIAEQIAVSGKSLPKPPSFLK